MMQSFLASGDAAEFILAITVIEIFGLFALRRAGAIRLAAVSYLPNILAGDFLLLAWLTSLRHAAWPVTAACLLAAFASHGIDLTNRFRSSGKTA
jgi:hypothetical protein